MKYHIHYVISVDTSLSPCATPLSLDNLLSVETIPKLIRIAFSWQIDCGSPRLEIAAIELGQIETKCQQCNRENTQREELQVPARRGGGSAGKLRLEK